MAQLTVEQWSRLDEFTLALHGLGSLDEARALALNTAARLIPHERSFFDLGSSSGDRLQFFSPLSLNMTEEQLREYYLRYQASDYTIWLFQPDRPVVYRDSDAVDDPVREETMIYQNWMKPMGVYYGMGCTLAGGGRLYGSLTLFRGREKGDFTDQELEVLRVMSRHLSLRFQQLAPGGLRPRSKAGGREDLLMERFCLTPREYEVLRLVCRGDGNREIADALFISENTVKKHLHSMFRKLGVSSRTQLLRRVWQDRRPPVP